MSEDKKYGVWIDTSRYNESKMPSHFLCAADGSVWRSTKEEAQSEAENWAEEIGVPCEARVIPDDYEFPYKG